MAATGVPLEFFLGTGMRNTQQELLSSASGEKQTRTFRRWRELDPDNDKTRPMEVDLGRHPFDKARSRLLSREDLMNVLPAPHRWLDEEHNDPNAPGVNGRPPEDEIWFPNVADPTKQILITQVFTYDAGPAAQAAEADFLVEVVRRRPIIFYRALPSGRDNGRTNFQAARRFFRSSIRETLAAQMVAILPRDEGHAFAASFRSTLETLQDTDELPRDSTEPIDVLIRPIHEDADGKIYGYASCHLHISDRSFVIGEAAFAIANDLPGFLDQLNQRSQSGTLPVQAFRADAPTQPLHLTEESPLVFHMPTQTLNGNVVPDLRGARFIIQTTARTNAESVSCLILQGQVTLLPMVDGSYRAFINGVEVAWQSDWQQP